MWSNPISFPKCQENLHQKPNYNIPQKKHAIWHKNETMSASNCKVFASTWMMKCLFSILNPHSHYSAHAGDWKVFSMFIYGYSAIIFYICFELTSLVTFTSLIQFPFGNVFYIIPCANHQNNEYLIGILFIYRPHDLLFRGRSISPSLPLSLRGKL